MKKFKFFILILITLIGISSSSLKVSAQACNTTGYDGSPSGSCDYGPATPGGPDVIDTESTQTECNAQIVAKDAISFTPDVYGDCTLPDGSVKTCWNRTSCVKSSGTFVGYYNLLAPLPQVGTNFNPNTNDKGNANTMGKYLNPMIAVFIGICAILAVIMILMGGIEYMTSELISNKEAGKERIKNALFGLMLALGAWTLLYTINPNLLKSDINAQDVSLTVVDQTDAPQTPDASGKYPGGGVKGAPWDTTRESLPYSDSNGLVAKIYNSECTTIGQTGCTSSEDLSLANIDGIENNCGKPCLPLSVQGGTEYWLHGGHSGSTTHGPGSATVDLGVTTALTNYIMTGNPATAPSAPPVYFHRYGIGGLYLFETNHWHVGQ